MPDALKTNLLDASFNGVDFPVAGSGTTYGFDSAKHRSYRRPGADIEPTGAREKMGTLNVPMYNADELLRQYGNVYPDLRNALVGKIEENPLGLLTHPVLGVFTAHIDAIDETLDPNARNGVALVLHWSEHNASAQTVPEPGSPTAASAPQQVQRLANEADAGMAKADPFGTFRPLAAVYAAQLALLDSLTPTYADLTAAFRLMLAPIAYNLGLSVFATAANYGVLGSLEALRNSTLALRAFYAPASRSPGQYVVPIDMALWQVASHLYGDAVFASVLLAQNSIPDPSLVTAGTVLLVPPVGR